MSDKPDCSICGAVYPERIVEFGTHRGESGTIGLSMCGVCWKAAGWHNQHTNSRCFSCADEGAKAITIAQPGRAVDGPDPVAFDLNLCRDCLVDSGGLLSAWDSDVGFRAKANVNRDWETQRTATLSRDEYRCRHCDASDLRLHVHHEIPRSQGGTDHLDNLVALCPDCHADEHDTEACAVCGSICHYEHNATWIDSSGGCACTFCEDCVKYIKRSGAEGGRCAICARFRKTSAKSEAIYFFSDCGGDDPSDVPMYTACDDCRIAAIFNSRKQSQQYFDDELPDSHVDIRHWEVAN